MNRKITALALATFLFATHCVTSPIPTTPLTPTPTAIATVTPMPTLTPTPAYRGKLGTIDRNVVYCTRGNFPLPMDIHYPSQAANATLPIVVNIHGGSWSGGDKERSEGAADFPELLKRGYVVVALNYRLAPTHKFPAQIEDVKCAIRFLRANAAAYFLDPQRIGVWGCSAGGHLAALAGVTDPSAGFDRGEYSNESSRVRAVAILSAPTDITYYDIVARAEMLKRVFDATTGINPALVRASPVTYVTADDPPFLILQADRDGLILPRHGEKLAERLNAVGGSAQLITVQNATHCFPPDPAMLPTRAEISQLIADLFDQHLRR